ncbi:protein FAM153B-like isoform X2 [Symphalangus syndactylus]|uniref:protein FAM153B-like isoform X2 n=1 Tax=Symphalangus syndactylus TaxID=9590 RepID=UPI003005F9ED
MRRTPGHDQDEDLAQETSSKDVPGVHMIHGDPATLEKILTKDLLQELSGYNGEEKDPEDVKKSSGVIQKELEDSTITGSHQQCQQVLPLHLRKKQQKRQKWKKKCECAAGRMMREADTCPCSSWLHSLSCCPIMKTRKPRKNALNCWDIFSLF